MINLSEFKITNIVILTLAIFLVGDSSGMTKEVKEVVKSEQIDRVINGQSGGSINSQGCGFIAELPNYEMKFDQSLDYMRLSVRADGGQPTLLVLGPKSGDSFCVLGDEISGLKPEISGVWESGEYQVFVGDRLGNRHKFILDISTDN